MPPRSGHRRSIALLATLDTKQHEADYLRERLETKYGRSVALLDLRTERGARTNSIAERMEEAAAGASERLQRLYSDGQLEAVIALGGGRGTAAACIAMRALPYEVPKLVVTAARTDMLGELIGSTNICVLPTVVDLNGLNRATTYVLEQAAGAINGMVDAAETERLPAPAAVVALSSFGVTAPAVYEIRQLLNREGCEVIPFPATGAGGNAMERMLLEGKFTAVADLSTTELADELVGGFATAGPRRLEAAGLVGLPQVVAPGALDMVNFGAPASIPDRFRDRLFYRHGPQTTVMRTTPEENRRLGQMVGRKLAAATGLTALLVPLRGFSAYDREDGPFYDPAATAAFAASAGAELKDTAVHFEELDCHINDAEFSKHLVGTLLSFLQIDSKRRPARVSA